MLRMEPLGAHVKHYYRHGDRWGYASCRCFAVCFLRPVVERYFTAVLAHSFPWHFRIPRTVQDSRTPPLPTGLVALCLLECSPAAAWVALCLLECSLSYRSSRLGPGAARHLTAVSAFCPIHAVIAVRAPEPAPLLRALESLVLFPGAASRFIGPHIAGFLQQGQAPCLLNHQRSDASLTACVSRGQLRAALHGVRVGEANNPGPGPASDTSSRPPFPCPLPGPLQPCQPRTSPPRVLSRLTGGCPTRQPSITAFFGSTGSAHHGSQPATATSRARRKQRRQAAPITIPPAGETLAEAAIPDPEIFRLAVVNPTTVLNKEAELHSLQAQIYLLAETAAVARAQDIVTARLRPAGYHWVWGSPVASHVSGNDMTTDSLRGMASGTAVASLFPVRPPFTALPEDVATSQRITVAHVRIGPLHARLVVLYGWPANHTAAAAKNEALLAMIWPLIATSPLPTIIGGDLNTDVTNLPSWANFEAMGYVELFQHMHSKYGQQLPATCRGSTRHDTVLLPTVFKDLLHTATVDTACHLFDSHAPVIVSFRLPQSNPCRQVWRKPTSWMPLQPDAAFTENAYCKQANLLPQLLSTCASKDDVDKAFLTWAQQVEAAVDTALLQAHQADPLRQPVAHLPRSARGRCAYRFLKSQPQAVSCPGARAGDYSPPDEALSHRSRLKVKQVRRLQGFARHLKALRQKGPAALVTGAAGLKAEWAAIQAAKGYPPEFAQWLLSAAPSEVFFAADRTWNLPSIHCDPFPPAEWLQDVLDFVRFDCEAAVRQEAKGRKDLMAYRAQLDASSGHMQQFKALRRPSNPPFQAVPVQELQPAKLHCCARDSWGLYWLPEPDFFRTHCTARTEYGEVQIGGLQQDEIHGKRLWLRHDSAALPETCQLQQATEASNPRELQRAFAQFWSPLWNRDKGAARHDIESWSDFITSLPLPPAAAQTTSIDYGNLQLWTDQLRRMNPRSATGYCGFSVAELKWLPPAPLQDLVSIFRLCMRFGWPNHMGRATVTSLAKVALPTGMDQSRPITVFATLYRFWSSTMCTALLRQWARWLPEGVMGCVPGRSVRDLSLQIELQVERSHLLKSPFGGFSIDIIKCFNQLPRLPLRFLLGHLQVPEEVLVPWFDLLDHCHRLPVFLGSIGVPLTSTTGMPEGDPLSVLAQVAVCWAADQRDLLGDAKLSSYVDNFTWTASTVPALQDALCDAQAFCKLLRLPIDWNKSFAWSTTRHLRRWFLGPAQRLLPTAASLKVVEHAKDLGVAFRFRQTTGLKAAAKRLSEGKRRLEVLSSRQLAPLQASHLIQSSIWPATFYGMEGRVLNDAETSALRGLASKAIVGSSHSANPYLALSALTRRVMDPELYQICQTLMALHRMLFLDRQQGNQWLHMAIEFQGTTRRPIGPATSLAKLLDRHDWTLYQDGTARGPGNAFLDLVRDPPGRIRAELRLAWLDKFPENVRHRNGLQETGSPAPELVETVLKALPKVAQRHVANIIVGGFQSNGARAKWDPLQDPACELCGMPDSKSHRILECPATSELRKLYGPLLQWISQHAPHWLHCPFPTVHEQEPFLRLLWRSRHLQPPQCLSRLVAQAVPSELHLFTDGTCSWPDRPAARHAAWAVLLYVGSLPAPISQQLRTWRTTGQLPAGWHVIAQGLVPRQQDINRAEVCAIVQALQGAAQFPNLPATVWTDSLNALRVFQAVQQRPGHQQGRLFCTDLLPHNLPELMTGNVTIRKVKAHQDLQAVAMHDEPLNLMCAMGNSFADAAAKHARGQDLEIVQLTCQQVYDWYAIQQEALTMYSTFLLALAKIVVPLKQAYRRDLAPTGAVDETQQKAAWAALQQPSTMVGHQIGLPQTFTAAGTGWPQWFVSALEHWTGSLRWPVVADRLERHAGITYLELLLNFAVCTGHLPPVRRLSASGTASWCNPLESDGILQPVVLRDCVVMLVTAVQVVKRHSKVDLWPSPRHHKLRTLEVLGYPQTKKGLLWRPLLHRAEQTGRLLVAVLASSQPGEDLRESLLRAAAS